jgi:hypothetical protein
MLAGRFLVGAPNQVDAYLAELANAAVFEQITGLVVARPYGYKPDQTLQLWSTVAGRTEAWGIPVLGNVECGHSDPMLTLPLGVSARVDATAKRFETLESALRPGEQTAPIRRHDTLDLWSPPTSNFAIEYSVQAATPPKQQVAGSSPARGTRCCRSEVLTSLHWSCSDPRGHSLVLPLGTTWV